MSYDINQEKEFQRDAGMIMLEKPRFTDVDPTIGNRLIIGPQLQAEALRNENPLQEREFVIIKDDPNALTWYCAEVRTILADRIEVNYYTTCTPVLVNYHDSPIIQKEKRLKEAIFLRAWCMNRGTGLPTTPPPTTNHGKMKHVLWWGRIPLEDIDKHVLIRGVGLSATGKLDRNTIKIAAKLEIPHHVEDFVDREAFQKHVKRVSNRLKRKR